MGLSFKEFNEQTLTDILPVLSDRFGSSVKALALKLFRCPERKPGGDAGCVVYVNDEPVGVNASIPRRFLIGKKQYVGLVGSMLAMRRGASPMALLALIRRTHQPRMGARLFFSNTAGKSTVSLKACVGVNHQGPDTWHAFHYAVLNWPCYLLFVFGKCLRMRRMGLERGDATPVVPNCPVLKKADVCVTAVTQFDQKEFEEFWENYQTQNSGFVCSRSYEEIQWAFGDFLSRGDGIVLIAKKQSRLVGYIVLRKKEGTAWWHVLDWLAVGNDSDVLILLLKAAKVYLRQYAKAVLLEMRGFPKWIREKARWLLPFRHYLPHNSFVWGYADPAFEQICSAADMELKSSWFFGPYDGDMVL